MASSPVDPRALTVDQCWMAELLFLGWMLAVSTFWDTGISNSVS